MRKININKVIREIKRHRIRISEMTCYDDEWKAQGYNLAIDRAIQIIKDNIKEVEDNKIDKLIDRADKIFEYLEPQITILPSDRAEIYEYLNKIDTSAL